MPAIGNIWAARARLLGSYRGQRRLISSTGNRKVKFMCRLPAFNYVNTTVGGGIVDPIGMTGGLGVTGEVFWIDR